MLFEQVRTTDRDQSNISIPELRCVDIVPAKTRTKRVATTRMLWPNATIPYLLTESLSMFVFVSLFMLAFVWYSFCRSKGD